MARFLGGQAVVLGGSVAGLLAARALAAHFERVVVLERDDLSAEAGPRKGTPHARHTHGLLNSGLQVLEDFFPGIRDDLVRRGAECGDGMARTRWHVGGDWHVQIESGLLGVCQSRGLLEQVIRERLTELPNVTIRDGINVTRLVAGVQGERITGVRLTDRRQRREELLAADLVVDAAGRGSRTPLWLEELGYARPVEERVEIDLTYATRIYRRRRGELDDNMAVIVAQSPPNTRFAVAAAVEGDRWSVTLGGMHDDPPPSDPEGFVQFARGLPTGIFHDFLRRAEPLSDVQLMRYPASLRRRYERLKQFPDGLIVLGDALCSFNPSYGQGMSVAALEAQALDECLRRGLQGLPRRYFRQAAAIVDVPWGIVVTADFRFPHVRGKRPWSGRLLNAWLGLVHRAAHADPAVCLAFHRVSNLLDPPRALIRPSIVCRVLKNLLKRWTKPCIAPACKPCASWSS